MEIGTLLITAFNVIVPMIMKALNGMEPHPTHTAKEGALLFKMVAARWMISGLVIYAVTPWHAVTSQSSIKVLPRENCHQPKFHFHTTNSFDVCSQKQTNP